MPECYLPGQVVRISVRISDDSGVAADPGAIALKVKLGVGAVDIYTYGVNAELIRDGVGLYHANIPLTAAGLWAYRWELQDPNAGAAEGVVNVQKSRFN